MKTDLHPEYDVVTVTCVCGNSFQTKSTMAKDFHVEICSACHPFFTGKQKLVDSAGRVDRFRKKYGEGYGQKPAEAGAEAPAPAEAKTADEPAKETEAAGE